MVQRSCMVVAVVPLPSTAGLFVCRARSCDLIAVPPRRPRSAASATVIPEGRMTCRTYPASAPNTLSPWSDTWTLVALPPAAHDFSLCRKRQATGYFWPVSQDARSRGTWPSHRPSSVGMPPGTESKANVNSVPKSAAGESAPIPPPSMATSPIVCSLPAE